MNLSELFGSSIRNMLMSGNLAVGDIFRVRLDERNGITPHKGQTYRFKFIIILGFDDSSIICGGVVINSKINQQVSELIKRYHFKIYKSDYNFLTHDSFVNCSNLIRVDKQSVITSEYLGSLKESDLNMIICTVRECPNINKFTLRQFGLI